MAISTDEMYNAQSRYLHMMHRIHFSGDKVLDVVKSNYLISSSTLEEAHRSSSNPFGEVVSGELTLSLVNQNEMFNPKNTSSPYHGYIRRGVKIESFIRPDEVDEWDRLGVFYVSNWDTVSGGMSADVTAHDSLYLVLNAPVPSLPIVKNKPFTEIVTDYFSLFGVDAEVDEAIQLVLPYWFTSGYTDNRDLLTDLMTAACAYCFCNHEGKVVVKSRTVPGDLRAEITDNDQIISAAVKHSLSTDYDSASVECSIFQESAEQSVLAIKAIDVAPGLTDTETTNFSVEKVTGVRSIKVIGSASVKPVRFSATADYIKCTLQGTSDTTVSLDIIGKSLEVITSVVSTEGSSAVEISSDYIQSLEIGNSVCDYADRYVKAASPELALTVRGNPRLSLGDKVQANSDRYKVNYVGMITRAKYNYTGSLSSEITLTNVAIEEV